ncbi:MAG: glycosyltransferase [Alphaproteobacteria bacterium]|nr:glycosyltransferase [Alphaproteobacteria bacterium]
MSSNEGDSKGISVLVPCYYSGNLIKETVRSVIDNGCPYPWEIIIVNDGVKSDHPEKGALGAQTLDALAEIQEWRDETGRPYPIKVIDLDENAGQSEAKNIALHAARYPVVLPVDSDDLLASPHNVASGKGFLQQAVEALADNADLDVVASDIKLFGHGGERIKSFKNF